MKLSIYTPEKTLLAGKKVRQIQAPSVKGELGILPGHAPLISLLQAGALSYLPEDSQKWERLAVGWGYLEIAALKNGETEARILAESAAAKETIDRAKAEAALKETQQRLEQWDLDPAERERLQRERLRLQSELDI